MKYTVKETPNGQTTGPTTVSAQVPPLAEAWERAREQNRAASTSDEFDRFMALAKTVVGVSKREIAGRRLAEEARKDPRIQAAFAAAALSGDEVPDDPQGLQDRIDRLTQQ